MPWHPPRRKITATALALFAQRGYDGVSVRDICKQVGIKESSLYYHFPSKQAILTTPALPTLRTGPRRAWPSWSRPWGTSRAPGGRSPTGWSARPSLRGTSWTPSATRSSGCSRWSSSTTLTWGRSMSAGCSGSPGLPGPDVHRPGGPGPAPPRHRGRTWRWPSTAPSISLPSGGCSGAPVGGGKGGLPPGRLPPRPAVFPGKGTDAWHPS